MFDLVKFYRKSKTVNLHHRHHPLESVPPQLATSTIHLLISEVIWIPTTQLFVRKMSLEQSIAFFKKQAKQLSELSGNQHRRIYYYSVNRLR